MKKLIAALALLVLSGVASATDYTLGHGGYYYQAGSLQPYTRTQVYRDGYYYHQYGYRYYQPGYYEYSYTPYYAPAPPALPKPSDPNWRTELLKIASQREENKAYEDALKLLGLNAGQPGGYGQAYNGVVQSTTHYGQTVSQRLNLYNQVDETALIQMSAQLAEQALNASREANGSVSGLISQKVAGNSRLLEILARGEAASNVLRNLEPPSKTESLFKFNSQLALQMPPATDPQLQVLPQKNVTMTDLVNAFSELAVSRCGSCHSDKRKEGGFALSDLNTMDLKGRQRVLARIHHTDVNLRMPKDAPALSAQEKQLWDLVLSK